MNISNHLTAKDLIKILISVYKKGNDSNDVKAIDIINEMKQNILSIKLSDKLGVK